MLTVDEPAGNPDLSLDFADVLIARGESRVTITKSIDAARINPFFNSFTSFLNFASAGAFKCRSTEQLYRDLYIAFNAQINAKKG